MLSSGAVPLSSLSSHSAMSPSAGTAIWCCQQPSCAIQPLNAALNQCLHLVGAQIPLEDVPSVQKEIVVRCRQMGKPVIIASHLLQSMMEYPTPTRAEVASLPTCLSNLVVPGHGSILQGPRMLCGGEMLNIADALR